MKLKIQYHHLQNHDFDKASCLSHQYISVFNKSSNINILILSISSHISSSLSSYPTTPEVLRKCLYLLPSKFTRWYTVRIIK